MNTFFVIVKTRGVCYFADMKHIVLGTAGHVDHGKTALIKALTGVDTDRLKEEKERGISIELGFASLYLRNQQVLGVVDVPGHERFIRNMVSGAAGIDLVVLVIAADEGVMPQTREHLHICTLLGIKKGIVVVTKIDLVDADWLDLVEDDITQFVKGTFLEDAPLIPVSSLSGAGLPELIDALGIMAGEIDEDSDSGIFRIPIDRVFTMKGFGTVVTGTLTSGNVKVGEEIAVLPRGTLAKIRGIQIHNQTSSLAEAGQRTAINLQGVEKAIIERGDVLARPHTFSLSRRLDVRVKYLPGHDRKIKNRSLVRFHAGTSEVIARMILLDKEELASGEEGDAQIILVAPTIAMAGDRFVLRSYSPVTTIGGGVIVDPLPRKHKRYVERVNREFGLLRDGADSDKIATIIERNGLGGVDIPQLTVRTGLHRDVINKALDVMYFQKKAVRIDVEDPRVVSFHVYQNFQDKILEDARAYHVKFPLKDGMLKEELRNNMGPFISSKLFNMAVRDLEKSGQFVVDREIVRMSGHRVDLKGELGGLRSEIAELYINAGLMPPTLREIMTTFSDQRDRTENVLGVMLKEGALVKINEDLYFHRDVIHQLRESYKNLLQKDGKATPASFKELTGLTRKFIIPLMEYFDMTKLTIRAGDHRILREREVK
jgi:selenocysteine-specific elongation factor